MRLRTFIAPNLAKAKDRVRSELGDDAVIVSTADTPGGGVEIRAASDSDKPMRKAPVDRAALNAELEQRIALQVLAHLRSDLTGRKGEKDKPDEADDPRAALKSELRAVLQDHSIGAELIDHIAATADKVDSPELDYILTASFGSLFSFAPLPIAPARPVMLVGPTGAGKTSTAGKLAARSLMAGEGANVFGADVSRAGAVEQIQTYADALEAAYWTISSPDELKDVLSATRLPGAIIIDSPGVNPYDRNEVGYIELLLEASGAEPVLVVPSSGDRAEYVDLAKVFHALGARRMILTKMDSARRVGAGVTAAHEAGLALAHFGVSPFIAEGLQTASAERLTQRITSSINRVEPEAEASQPPQERAS